MPDDSDDLTKSNITRIHGGFSSSFTLKPTKHSFYRADQRDTLSSEGVTFNTLLISQARFMFLKELHILIERSCDFHIKFYNNSDFGLRIKHTRCTVLSRFWGDILKLLLFHSKIACDPVCRCLTPLCHICNWHSIQRTGSVQLYTATYQVKKCIASI